MTEWIITAILLSIGLISFIWSEGLINGLISIIFLTLLGIFIANMEIYFGRVGQAISVVAIFVLTIYLNYRNYKNKNEKKKSDKKKDKNVK